MKSERRYFIKPRPRRFDLFDRRTALTAGLIILMLCCMAALVISARAFPLGPNRAANVILVPADYETIQAAIDAAPAGAVIQVSTGIYSGSITLYKAVTLTAESFDQVNPANNTTVIDGNGGATAILIPPGLTEMPTIRGFVIRNNGDGIQASSPFIAEFNYFSSSRISVNYQRGGGGSNRNNIYYGATDDAIHIENITLPLLIESNRIMYAGDDGIEIHLQNIDIPAAETTVDIWNNMIVGNRGDGVQFVDYAGEPQHSNRRFVLWANLIANNVKAGVGLTANGNTVEDYLGADVVEPIRIINNTFFGNDYGISGGDNLVAINNIISSSVTRGAWNVQGPGGSNSVIAYSLFHNNGTDTDQTTLGAGIITGQDPLFSAGPNPGPDGTWQTVDDDFSKLVLGAGSPAIDRGITQYTAVSGELVPPNPIAGFVGTAPDLGWREFGSPAFITPTPTATLANTQTPVLLTATVPTPTAILQTPIIITATMASPTLSPPSPTATATVAVPTATPTQTATLQPPTSTATSTVPSFAILSINPISAQAGTTVNLTLTGIGFAPNMELTFEGGQGVAPEVVSLQVVDSATITAVINVRADAVFGTQVWDIRVTAADDDDTTAVLQEAFTVIP